MTIPTAHQPAPKRGAGVIPFAVHDGLVNFLFQITFSGRKCGYLIDFGGGSDAGEDARATAIREFVEETETMYFATDLQKAHRSDAAIRRQASLVAGLFEKTLKTEPGWCCRRRSKNAAKPKDWNTFFIEFPFRDVEPLNRQWESGVSGRFKKRRELVWISGDELLTLYSDQADRLWKRVRQLENAPKIVAEIIDRRHA